MFLTPEQLRELTGYKRRPEVIGWLTKNGYPYDLAADGWPRVLSSYLEQRLGGMSAAAPAKREPRLRLA